MSPVKETVEYITPDRISKFNIGGQIFEVELPGLKYLKEHEDSKLFKDIYKRTLGYPSNYKTIHTTTTYWNASDNQDSIKAYWYDRDPLYFRGILRYLRTGKVTLDQGMSAKLLKEEADYFGILNSKFEEACRKKSWEMEMLELKLQVNLLLKKVQNLEGHMRKEE